MQTVNERTARNKRRRESRKIAKPQSTPDGILAFNRVSLAGVLSCDVNLTQVNSQAVGRFGVAVRSADGQGAVCFQQVVVWGKLAKIAKQTLRKGSPLHVEGYLQTESWTDRRTRQRRSRNVLMCESLRAPQERMAGKGMVFRFKSDGRAVRVSGARDIASLRREIERRKAANPAELGSFDLAQPGERCINDGSRGGAAHAKGGAE